ncbi:PEP-CTERM sorting domain-containing protein [bacterium]|nr:PEP-CTERM sorting domain-containing protein [Akkermansiaceae bacterium]MDB4736910.1 PEP-CTERM sorting domain-containing protein [bacterium]MDC0327606.1 PEP-CTERM sorting domain-containing protein [Akkermansiaceae bacterium]
MNKAFSLSITIFSMSSTAALHAAVIAEWTFDTGANSAARLASSSVSTGATISGLSFNDSFTDVGPGAVPNDVHDGFGFGGNSGDQVIFLHRANYFDGSPVPSPRPTVNDYTSWGQGSANGTGGDLSSNGNAPILFTVGADALSSVTVDSLTIDFTSGGASIWQIQEAGAAEGSPGTLNPGNPLITVALNAPVVIGAGETKTFTINVNSGALNSLHNIDGLALNGTVASIPEPSSGILLCLGALALTKRRRK